MSLPGKIFSNDTKTVCLVRRSKPKADLNRRFFTGTRSPQLDMGPSHRTVRGDRKDESPTGSIIESDTTSQPEQRLNMTVSGFSGSSDNEWDC